MHNGFDSNSSYFITLIQHSTEPVPPLKPQRFVISDVTSTSIHLEWTVPLHCGGGSLDGYILSYLEPIVEKRQTAGQNKKVSV